MKIAILGIGAIGSYITAMFSNNTQHELHLLARSNFTVLKNEGIIVNDIPNSTTWHAHRFEVYDSIDKMSPCDVIILATKTSQNAELLPHISRICHATTKIISLQNGLNFEEEIHTAIPTQPLYSGTCWIKVSRLEATNCIRHDFGENIKLGQYASNQPVVKITADDDKIKSLFESAKLECDLTDNIKSVQLTKLALNVPFFTLMARDGKTVSEILADATADIERQNLQEEIINASSLISSPVDDDFIKQIISNLRKMPVTIPASREILSANMKKDLPANTGALIALMHSHNICMAKLEQLYFELCPQEDGNHNLI